MLGIQHLQQRGAGVALNAAAELVDLVQHHHAVAGARFADRLDDVAGQSADIGSSMTAYLRLVVHAAETDPHELAVHRAGDRLAERRLAHARRPDKAQDRRLAARRKLADGQIFDDPALDFLETEVVLIEDAARRRDVDRRLLGKAPGQVHQPVEIGPHHPVFAGGFRHALQAPQLLAGLVLDLFWHIGVADRLFELGDFGRLSLVAFAELALNGRHLLAQQDFAVARVERRLGLSADLLRQSQNLDPMGQQPRDPLQSGDDIHGLEDFLLLVRRRVHEGRHQIGERAGRIDALDGRQQFVWRLRQELYRLYRLLLEMDKAGLDLVGRRGGLGNFRRLGDEERPAVQILDDPEPLLPLAHEMMRSIRRRDVADDIGDRPHAMQIDWQGIVDLGVALHHDADRLLLPDRSLRGLDRAGAAERDWQHHSGKQNHAAHRDDDQRVRRQRRLRGRAGILFGAGRGLCVSHRAPPTFAA